MRKAAKQIGICALALILFCVLCRLTVFRTYTAHVPVNTDGGMRFSDREGAPRAKIENPGILELGEMNVRSDFISVPIHPKHPGEADVHLYDSQGKEIAYRYFRVGPMGTVFDYHNAENDVSGEASVGGAVPSVWEEVQWVRPGGRRNAQGMTAGEK